MVRILHFPPHRPVGLKTWLAIFVTLIISIAALSVVAILAVGALLVFVPILLIAIAAYAISPKRRARERRRGRAQEPEVIDAEFRVMDSTERDRDRLGGEE